MTKRIIMIAIFGLGLAACGGTPQAAKPAGAPSVDENTANLVKYAQCMRQNGVPTFPDPVNGKLELKYGGDNALDINAPQFKTAQETCKSLAPAGTLSGPGDGQQVQQMLKFAECMRENGVKDFPDPKDGNLLIDGVDPETPQFKTAMQTCRKFMPGGGPAGGQ
ncbi:hypothetical protein ABZ897_58075 [Nonomuraea sp. NPDC046802]|uniref:hypothetical protein n=1 Tax=Nonomuraea sp. NPDC046802 TaxID=3154919 RepID=UPI0033C9B6C4